MLDSEGQHYAEEQECYGRAVASGGAFWRLLFNDMTVEKAGCYYAYELMDAAKPLTKRG